MDPFVGRRKELRLLESGFEASQQGRPALFILSGEAGIGKTRLALEFGERARALGAQVFSATCWEGDGAPAYWPWTQLFRARLDTAQPTSRQLRTDSGTDALHRLFPDLAVLACDPSGGHGPAADQRRFHFFEAVGSYWQGVARDQPLVLLFDDLQWSDAPSLALLRFLVRHLTNTRLFMLATHRVGGSNLDQPLDELARDAQRIDLGGLRADEVTRYTEAVLGRQPPDDFVCAILDSTGGNPLFLRETVRSITEAVPGGNEWQIRIPSSVREIVRQRMTTISAEARELLDYAAVQGVEFNPRTVSAAAGVSLERALAALDECRASSLLRTVDETSDSFAFAHGLIHSAVYDTVSSERRCELHQRIGETLESMSGSSAPAEIADHFFRALPATDPAKTADLLVRAAELAGEVLAFEDAVVHYSRALEAMERGANSERRRAEILLEIAACRSRAGDAVSARTELESVARLARTLDDAEMLGRAALGVGEIWGKMGVIDVAAIELLEEALSALGDEESVLRAKIMACLAAHLRWSDSQKRRDDLSGRAVAQCRQAGDDAALTAVLAWRHWSLWAPQNVRQRLETSSEIIDLARKNGDRSMSFVGRTWHVVALIEVGEIGAVLREMEYLAQLADDLRQPFYFWWLYGLQASLALVRGDFDRVEELSTRAYSLGESIYASDAFQTYGAQISTLRMLQGRAAELRDALIELGDKLPNVPIWRCTLAMVYSELGDEGKARTLVEALVEGGLDDFPRDQQWLSCLITLAEACTFLKDAPRASVIYEHLHPYAEHIVTAGAATACFGSAALYLGRLATVIGDYAGAEIHFDAAIEANTRMQAAPYLARTRLAYAQLLAQRQAEGDAARAVELCEDAIHELKRMGMMADLQRARDLAASVAGPRRASPNVRSPNIPAVFRRDAEYWTVEFGGTAARYRDAKGMRYIAYLLVSHGEEIHVFDLSARASPAKSAAELPSMTDPESAAHGLSVEVAGPDAAPDPVARARYRERLDEVHSELEEAERFHDTGRIAVLRAERDALSGQLMEAYGGDPRKRNATVERARKAVANRIRAAVAKIGKQQPALAHHLDVSLRTGTFCTYRPDTAIDWALE